MPHYLAGLHGAGVGSCRGVFDAFGALVGALVDLIRPSSGDDSANAIPEGIRIASLRAMTYAYAPFDASMLIRAGAIDLVCSILPRFGLRGSGAAASPQRLQSESMSLELSVAQFVTLLAWSSYQWSSLLPNATGGVLKGVNSGVSDSVAAGPENGASASVHPVDASGIISTGSATITLQKQVLRAVIGHLEELGHRATRFFGFRLLLQAANIESAQVQAKGREASDAPLFQLANELYLGPLDATREPVMAITNEDIARIDQLLMVLMA